MARVRLAPWSESDRPLLERLNTAEVTAHLGGPEPPDRAEDRWRRRAGANKLARVALLDVSAHVSQPGGRRDRGRRRRRRDFALFALLAALMAGLLATAALASHARAVPSTAVARAIAAARPAPSAAPAFFSTTWLAAHPSPDLGVTARAGILVDLDRRQVLWARAEQKQRAPASLTKMVTAMVALDHTTLDHTVTVPDTAVGVEPDVMGLSAGEQVTVRDLMYGLFLDSGNDAAETLSQALMPRDRFLAAMNAKVAGWGLRDTHFTNPSGLDAAGLFSSAYDLAVIAGHLELDHPELMAIAGTREHPIPGTAQHKAFDPYSLNKLLWQYPGATGLKTGFTDDAGGCVAGTATRGGRHLVAIVLGSDVFFTDAGRLLDYGFSVPG